MSRPPRAKKRFGQHFLHDPSVIDAIVRGFAAPPGAAVVEIGPGAGAITGALLDRDLRLAAVEIDRDMHVLLEQRFGAHGNFRLVAADILDTDIAALYPGERIHVIGNLPYNITTPILFHLVTALPAIEDMYFMVQKEVAERLAADAGNRRYGRPSVMLQHLCEVEIGMTIEPGAFRPPPRVTSAMLRLRPRETPLGGPVDVDVLHRLVAAAFAKRRKTLRNALRGEADEALLAAAGIDPGTRAEQVDVAAYVRLAREWKTRTDP